MITDQGAQDCIQLGLEKLQGWQLHSFFRPLFHCLTVPTKKPSPYTPFKPHASTYVCCLLSSSHTTEQPGSTFFTRCGLWEPSREGNHFCQSTGSALVNTAQDPVGHLCSRDTLLAHGHCDAHQKLPGVFLPRCSPPTQAYLGIFPSLGQDFVFVPVELHKVPRGQPLPSGPSEQQPGPHEYCRCSPHPFWGCSQLNTDAPISSRSSIKTSKRADARTDPTATSLATSLRELSQWGILRLNINLRKDLGRLPTATHQHEQEGQEQLLGSPSSGWPQASSAWTAWAPAAGTSRTRAGGSKSREAQATKANTLSGSFKKHCCFLGCSLWKRGYHRC